MSTLLRILRPLIMMVIFCACAGAYAFDLADLEAQLKSTQVVKGQFVQEKRLRSLPVPLTSTGKFVMSTEQGLLWILESPVPQTIRITSQGIDVQGEDGSWQPMTGAAGASRQNSLLLSLIGGDTKALEMQFDMTLKGTAQDWNITMTPRAALLRQIFERLEISGGMRINTIALYETQGDSTVLKLHNTIDARSLSPEEARAYAPQR